jgi:hypothetical protein
VIFFFLFEATQQGFCCIYICMYLVFLPKPIVTKMERLCSRFFKSICNFCFSCIGAKSDLGQWFSLWDSLAIIVYFLACCL